jgi:dihydroflavonol-4-reductase
VIGEFLRLQLRGLLPAVFGADTGFTFVHVEDVAEGHVLAAEKGEAGQAYVLAGEVMTAGDMLQLTSRLAGIAAPLVQLDSRWVAPLIPLAEWLEQFVALPLLFSSETLRSTGRTWWVTSAKAERGLGYTHRSVEEGMAETVLWEAERLRAKRGLMQMPIVLVLAAVAGLFGLSLLLRRRKNVQ